MLGALCCFHLVKGDFSSTGRAGHLRKTKKMGCHRKRFLRTAMPASAEGDVKVEVLNLPLYGLRGTLQLGGPEALQ